MTKFLDVKTIGKLIQQVGIENTLKQMADHIVDDYCRWSEFEKSSRVASHSPRGVIELMPVADKTHYSFKYVNGHPGNTEKNLLTVMAFGCFAEVETGLPLLISEMTLLTALRTAAISAAVARVLARKNSRTMAVIGCGAQSEFQIMAFKSLLGIWDIRLYETDPDAAAKLRRNLANEGLSFYVGGSAEEAVQGSDIVTTITAEKTKAAILHPDMIEEGMFINAVGGDCPGKTELHPDVLRMGRVFVEYEAQTRLEGDIQQMPADFPVTELWKIFTGIDKGRAKESEITIFDSVGFALSDFSALRYAHDVAGSLGIGFELDLVPALPDPKDLYSLVSAMPLPLMPVIKEVVAVERKLGANHDHI